VVNTELWYGGDYNPEQWPETVWDEDTDLMQQAGVNLVSVGIFSWAKLEPREGEFDFGWLDRIIDKLHAAGVRVDLATATASPPPWLTHKYPEVLPVTETGVRYAPGSRQQFCPSSPIFKKYAARLVTAIAERYSAHPALEMWHVSNEYACHVPHCYCTASAAAFRSWLRTKYGTIEDLNAAWGTAFWSQQYGEFEEIYPPSLAPTFRNPTQLLDFDRFSSDELLSHLRAESAILRAANPDIPITTNFMGFFKPLDYWRWAEEVDFVSNDSYPDPADENSPAWAAMTCDLVRSLKGGQPWVLMEQAPGAVNWRRHNAAKLPGMQRAWTYQAIARGADGILFFQWRASVAGAERFHSGMVPHAGTNTRSWREIEQVGAELKQLAPMVGARVDAHVAIVFEWDSWWSIEQLALPSDLSYVQGVFAWYRELLRRNVVVDFVKADADLSGYAAVLVPSLFVATTSSLENLDAYAQAGGHLLVTYQTGICDANLRITDGGYLGALKNTLGLWIEEFAVPAGGDLFRTGETPPPALAITGSLAKVAAASTWAEYLHTTTAEVLEEFSGGALDGQPAITRNAAGSGVGWYTATLPDDSTRGILLERILSEAGVDLGAVSAGPTVETVRRGSYLVTIDHGSQAVSVTPDAG
jgi:beta-galactosidase